jgi:hypothetical protein
MTKQSNGMQLVQKITVISILVLGFIFWYKSTSMYKHCDRPISYTLGSFDTRFGISKKDFLDKIKAAASVWNKASGKTVFEYDPKGDLVINLIYDTRQKTTQKNIVLEADVNKINNLASSVKAQYLSLETEYTARNQAYTDEVALFEQNQNNYKTKVDYWNNNGGAPPDEYNALTIEQQKLLQEQTALEEKRLELNSTADQMNEFAKNYNVLVGNANSNINTINQSAGKEFEEGLYYPAKNEIDIYEFSSNQKLIRVLIHELGHALDLAHNNNPKSIMYPINSGTNLSLSTEDLQELKTRCNLK